MNDKAKIAALREALEISQKALDCLGAGKNTRDFAMKNAAEALALTADDAEPAPVEPDSDAPVYWQWRKKSNRWEIDKIFNSQVYATTDISEVRGLYTRPATTPAPIAAEPAPAIRPTTGGK